MTYDMNPKQFEAVCNLPASKRYSHFISKVVDFEELWTLKSSDGFILYGDENNQEIIPFWPHPEYATAVKRDDWNNYSPYKIDLDPFLKKWIPGMIKDKRMAGIFVTSQEKGIVVTPSLLEKDLKEELKLYE